VFDFCAQNCVKEFNVNAANDMYVLLKWDILHSVVGEWKSDSTLLLTSHKSGCWNVFHDNLRFASLHFTACLLTNSSSDVNIRAM
jgi:hypothetical protein